MENFTFDVDTKIYFGRERLEELPDAIKLKGKKVLLVYGGNQIKKSGLYDKIKEVLSDFSVFELNGIIPNPSVEKVYEGIDICKANGIEQVLAVGGGSVIDSAKSIALGSCVEADIWKVFERKHRIDINQVVLPISVVLTSSATGSEMNGFAVISNESVKQKLAFSHKSIKPFVSFLDPTFLMTLPEKQISAGVVDSMSHVLEQYFSSHEDEGLVDRQAEAVIKTIVEFGRQVLQENDDYYIRANLMWAATLSLNNSLILGRQNGGDWLAHEIEHQISALFPVIHADGIAVIHPGVLRYFYKIDCEKECSLIKFVNLAKNVFGFVESDEKKLAERVIEEISLLIQELGMPQKLSSLVENEQVVSEIAMRVTKDTYFGTYHKVGMVGILEIMNDVW